MSLGPTPEEARRMVALTSARRVAAAVTGYCQVPDSVCRAMADAFLADMGTAGYLAELTDRQGAAK